MRSALLAALVLVVLASPLVARPPSAHACSCIGPPETEDGVRHMLQDPGWDGWVMFTGFVDDRDESPVPYSSSVDVTVDRVYLGQVPARLTVRDTGDGGSCGHNPGGGSREFIVARPHDDGTYAATICGSFTITTDMYDGFARFLAALDTVSPGYSPSSGTGSDPLMDSGGVPLLWIAIAGGVVLLIAVSGIAAIRMRRAD